MSYRSKQFGRGRGSNNWRTEGGPSTGPSHTGPPKRQQQRFGTNKGRGARNNLVIDENIQEACPEELRIKIDQTFKEFLQNSEQDVYIFPSDLNNLQRKYIHWKAQRMNLVSKSHGKEPNRQLHLQKKPKDMSGKSFQLNPSPEILDIVNEYEINHGGQEDTNTDFVAVKRSEKVYGRLQDTTPVVPRAPLLTSKIKESRLSLPIHPQKHVIMNAINENQVIIISSETGSGKTTQIPQYIMEESTATGKPVKIICTQPRRISTIAAADRVAHERGESVGASVGYHIRLESKCGYNTTLIYCTVGVFLRNLMCGSKCLKNITHVIVDEIHERDKLSDFLLICLRQNLAHYSHLRIILMSATVNVEKFQEYFQTSVVMSIPGRLHDIQAFFLEDVLKMTGYLSNHMKTAMEKLKRKEREEMQYAVLESSEKIDSELPDDWENIDQALEAYMNFSDQYDYKLHYEEATADLMQYFISEDVPVDYRHSQKGLTALMIAAHLGDLEFVTKLVNMGAKLDISDALGRTAMDYAKISNQNNMTQYLEYVRQAQAKKSTANPDSNATDSEFLGKLYDMTTPDDFLDYDLIVHIVKYIFDNSSEGSILIFLPGYEEIMQCSDRITSSEDLPQNYRVFFLHSSMNMKDQCDVFEPLKGTRKIILSTNIAETSITIEDVVFVIDSGKAKEKTYDSYNKMSALQTQWISRACAKQREGRAGRCRPGLCLRLFSSQRYEHMAEERVPEILRVSLEELCLHAKIIAPSGMNIYNFLSLAPDPPSANSVKVAIESLQSLGALDKEEDLTKLGEYLAQLTVEPKLGKMLIYGCIFKCLEPLLTLAASMAHKDPFQLPPQANLKSLAAEKRRELTGAIQSDHLLYLRVFQQWQQESQVGKSRQFCYTYFISESTMQSVMETRRQLLGQLRATGFVNNATSIDQFNLNRNNWGLVKSIMSCAFYPNIAYPVQRGLALATRYEKKVSVDNRSACSRKCYDHWLFYDEMVKQRVNFVVRGATAFTPFMMSIMCGTNPIYPTPDSLNLDDWVEFSFPHVNIVKFRKAVHSCIDAALSNPWQYFETPERPVVSALVKIMAAEEINSGLEQPDEIGVRPIFLYKNMPNGGGPRKSNSSAGTNASNENWRNRSNAKQNYVPTHHRQNAPRVPQNNQRQNERHGHNNRSYSAGYQQAQNMDTSAWNNGYYQGGYAHNNYQQPGTSRGQNFQGQNGQNLQQNMEDPASVLLRGLGVANKSYSSALASNQSFFTDYSQIQVYATASQATITPLGGHSNTNLTPTPPRGVPNTAFVSTPQGGTSYSPNNALIKTSRYNTNVDYNSNTITVSNTTGGNSNPTGGNFTPTSNHGLGNANIKNNASSVNANNTVSSSRGDFTPKQPPYIIRKTQQFNDSLGGSFRGSCEGNPVMVVNSPSRGILRASPPSQPYVIRKTRQFNDNVSGGSRDGLNFVPFQFYLPLAEVICGQEGHPQNQQMRVPRPLGLSAAEKKRLRYGEYPENPMYFFIKAEHTQNMLMAVASNRWVFSPQTEKKVIYFAELGKRMILIYYIKHRGEFAGVAEYRGFDINIRPKPTALVNFLYTCGVDKGMARHLPCFYDKDGNEIVENAADGTVLSPKLGESLLKLFEKRWRQIQKEKMLSSIQNRT